ncbi:hypothetical protein PENTCL1PPCAC_11912, partial [Pristionchus entomophagus]
PPPLPPPLIPIVALPEMRPDAPVDYDGDALSTAISIVAFLFVPLGALAYCAGGKSNSGGRVVDTSQKSKSVTKSTMSSMGAANAATIPDGSPGAAKSDDFRPQWTTQFLETQTPNSLGKEFIAQLQHYVAPGRTQIVFESHLTANRYNDIPCFDQDRIILKGPTDYINANYMHAPDGVKYIATQGPLPETRNEFWQMVVQEEVLIILQLCKFVEGYGVEKCAEYWPAGEKDTATTLDRFTIRKIDKREEIAPGTVKTKLRIESKTVNRTIQHIYCDSWPDQLAPSDPAIIIKIWNYIKANRDTGPVVVHCSAGVGRTATFIGISYGVEMLKKQGGNIIDIVKEMRKSRPKAVQTHIQYGFLHAALLELFIQQNLVPRSDKATAFFEAFKNSAEMQASNK